MQPYPLAQRCGRPSQLTECNTSSLVSHGNSGTSQQVSLLLCNRPVRECASPGSPPLLCCCAPRCDLGERAGSRAHGPGVHRRGSVRTKAKAASISHLTSCAQKTATVLRENVTSFLFKYSIQAGRSFYSDQSCVCICRRRHLGITWRHCTGYKIVRFRAWAPYVSIFSKSELHLLSL